MFQTKIIDGEYSWKNMSLNQFLLEGNIPSSWEDFFMQPEVLRELSQISDAMSEEKRNIHPEIDQVFRAFYLVPPEKVKVVIIGQDPYHTANKAAVGLCFSVRRGNPINPSLRNIYSELKKEGYKPVENGDLLHWAAQGCLMLNSALTVEEGNADSHASLWYTFYDLLIDYLVKKVKKACWLLMGKSAQSIIPKISKTRAIFCTSHPSPFSYMRSSGNIPAFLGSNVFKKINEALTEWNREEIKW